MRAENVAVGSHQAFLIWAIDKINGPHSLFCWSQVKVVYFGRDVFQAPRFSVL
jgi:hypothetical protein